MPLPWCRGHTRSPAAARPGPGGSARRRGGCGQARASLPALGYAPPPGAPASGGREAGRPSRAAGPAGRGAAGPVPGAGRLRPPHRSGESAASIGLDATRPWSDLRWGVGLAALVGGVGLGIYILAIGVGVNRTVIPIPPTGHCWAIPGLLLD